MTSTAGRDRRTGGDGRCVVGESPRSADDSAVPTWIAPPPSVSAEAPTENAESAVSTTSPPAISCRAPIVSETLGEPVSVAFGKAKLPRPPCAAAGRGPVEMPSPAGRGDGASGWPVAAPAAAAARMCSSTVMLAKSAWRRAAAGNVGSCEVDLDDAEAVGARAVGGVEHEASAGRASAPRRDHVAGRSTSRSTSGRRRGRRASGRCCSGAVSSVVPIVRSIVRDRHPVAWRRRRPPRRRGRTWRRGGSCSRRPT